MAAPVVGLEATNVFSLGANFHAQKSTIRTVLDRAMMQDSLGNQQCETMINQRDEVTVSYAYCNAVPALATDLSTFLTKFGDVAEGYIITGLTINFTAGAYATVDVTGHAHAANTHTTSYSASGYADVSAAIPSGAGFGVPTWAGVTLGDNATPISASVSFSMNHVDVISTTGGHFVGKNLTPTAEITVGYQGVPSTAQPMTNWTTDSYGGDDSNSEFDTYEVTAHRYFDLATS